ncbi:MAG: hypothetical protein J2P46_12560 [Zavarzinella sp.]|nr:hypothetical protein [Zavarzinella sp.]
MPISIACPRCNWKGRVKDELAGRKGKCPTCGELIPIPLKGSPPPVPAGAKAAVDDAPDIVDDADIVEDEPRPKPKSAASSRVRRDEDGDDRPRKKRRDEDDDDDRPAKARRRRDDDDDDNDRPLKARRRLADDDDDDDRPRKKRRVADYDDYDDDEDDRPRKKRRGTVRRNRGGGNSGKKIGTIVSGVICLLIGIGLFALGIVLGKTNFWGIGLTVVGIISIVQGLAQPSGSSADDDDDD